MKDYNVSISLKTILIVAFLFFGFYWIYLIKDILMMLFIALIIMSALNPGVSKLERRKVPRSIGILFLYLLVLSFFGIVFRLVVPPLSQELSNLLDTFDVSNFPLWLTQVDWTTQEFGSWTFQDISTLLAPLGNSLSSLVGVVSSTFFSIFFFFTILVMSYYLLIDRKNLHTKLFWSKHSEKYETLAKEFIDSIELQLGGWVRGQLVLMLAIGVITYIILAVLGVRYALPLAVLAGLLEILPNLGPTVAAVPAVAVAFIFMGPSMGLVVLATYVLVQQVENNILVPRIMKAAVNIEPITSIVLILIGLRFAGVMGALLAIPFYIILRTAYQLYLRETHQAKSA